jgi:hypothetical protein
VLFQQRGVWQVWEITNITMLDGKLAADPKTQNFRSIFFMATDNCESHNNFGCPSSEFLIWKIGGVLNQDLLRKKERNDKKVPKF